MCDALTSVIMSLFSFYMTWQERKVTLSPCGSSFTQCPCLLPRRPGAACSVATESVGWCLQSNPSCPPPRGSSPHSRPPGWGHHPLVSVKKTEFKSAPAHRTSNGFKSGVTLPLCGL